MTGLLQRLTGAARRAREEAELQAREEAELRARKEAERRKLRNLIADLARLLMLALNIVLLLLRGHVFWGAGPRCHL